MEEKNKLDAYIRECEENQFKNGAWSFLEASNNPEERQIVSWSRNLGYSDSDEEFFDEIYENTFFADWAKSLNISSDKKLAELLWANAQQLINSLKIDYYTANYSEGAEKLNILIQLYWQLKNIYDLGFQNFRKEFELPEEEEMYLNPEVLSEYGRKYCNENLEWGYEALWDEVIGWSHTPKHFHFSNWDDYSDAADTIYHDYNDEDDEEWDEDEEAEFDDNEDDED